MAQLSGAILATEAVQNDSDLLFGRILLTPLPHMLNTCCRTMVTHLISLTIFSLGLLVNCLMFHSLVVTMIQKLSLIKLTYLDP